MRARDGVLDTLRADPHYKGSVFNVLLATSTEAAPFRGRKDDLAWLDRWWDDPTRPVAVVTGPAGTGKTRLVTQFALSRPAPCVSGWLSGGRGTDAVAVIRACGNPALVLIDDADQRPDLAAFLASLTAERDAATAVRVIMISRGTGLADWLAASLDDRFRGMLESVGELPLGPIGSAHDRARWFAEATRAYARARHVPPPDLPAHLSGYVTDPAEPILALHAQALLAVLNSEGSRPMRPRAEGEPFDRVAAALFAHERHRWQASARQPEFGLTDLTSPVQARAIAVLLLASPIDQAEAVAVLRKVPELDTASAERRANVARWAAHLYPSDPPWPVRLKPDMLAEWFAVTQVGQTPELAGLFRVMTPAQEVALLVLLAHASDQMSEAVQLFANVVATDTTRLAEAAVAAALTASTALWRLDGALAGLIGEATWSADALGQVENQLTDRLPRTSAAASEARVQIARKDGNAADLAGALDGLGNHLDDLGRDREAGAAAQESVDLYRALARDNPVHQPGLAGALGNLGMRLGDLGRDREAGAAAQESVDLYRALARDNPALQHDLAGNLTNLGIRLASLGRDREALAATEEAVDLYRGLAPVLQPGLARVLQPGLATALGNLGNQLGDLGRNREALAATEEAVDLYRVLVQVNPARQPELAGNLTNLGNCLGDLGRDREAGAAAQESVDLYRALARDNPAHQPGLAMALGNLGMRLAILGRSREALAASAQAVELYRALARDNPAHQPDLARNLMNLGIALGDLGRNREALAATDEAVDLYRALARDNPALQIGLARNLTNLGNCLISLGRDREALAAAQESVDLYRALARDNPAHQPDLAKALHNLRNPLTSLGHDREALAAAEEAVDVYRALARVNPDQYRKIYNRELALLRRDLHLRGKDTASILLHIHDDSPERDEPHHIPPAPN